MDNKLDLTNIKNAVATLEEAINYYNTDVEQPIKNMYADSCIQRFEYTYELSWKIMKKYLKLFFNKTEQELTIKNIFRYTQGYGLIQDWTKWVEYNDARNNTLHEYNLNKTQFVLMILQAFLKDVKSFIICLEQSINENN